MSLKTKRTVKNIVIVSNSYEVTLFDLVPIGYDNTLALNDMFLSFYRAILFLTDIRTLAKISFHNIRKERKIR